MEDIRNQDCVEGLKELESDYAQIIICDPPYNIGKDFGNDSDKRTLREYIDWCKEWINECLRILKADGTLYIYGFSEILSHIQVHCLPSNVNARWLIWHYTNKNVPSLKFWQRSHESILCIWKCKGYPHFNLDDVREPYTEGFLKNAVGRTRTSTKGRFNKGEKETTYTAHDKGALPRDVIKIAALAGGAGKKERVNHPTQKPLDICTKLLQASRKAPDGIVVIPFAGSGSECVACKHLGIGFIAFEINEAYVELTRTRLANCLESSSSPSSATPDEAEAEAAGAGASTSGSRK